MEKAIANVENAMIYNFYTLLLDFLTLPAEKVRKSTNAIYPNRLPIINRQPVWVI